MLTQPNVYETDRHTKYLQGPGVILIGRTESLLGEKNTQSQVGEFMTQLGYDPNEYFDEDFFDLPGGEQIMKFAGQGCYQSYGEGHTGNDDEAVERYFTNQKQNKDGSVFEHASLNFWIYGISRSLSHELVRHRAGYGFSQLSQRYVDGSHLRFVEGPEYQKDETLHEMFQEHIDHCAAQYEDRAGILEISLFPHSRPKDRAERVFRRKVANAAARRCLPNETETMLTVTANVRALRHTLEQRSSIFAEVEIRRLFDMIYQVCIVEVPHLFTDYKPIKNEDGTITYDTPYPKA